MSSFTKSAFNKEHGMDLAGLAFGIDGSGISGVMYCFGRMIDGENERYPFLCNTSALLCSSGALRNGLNPNESFHLDHAIKQASVSVLFYIALQ
jgi:hypothetical protein